MGRHSRHVDSDVDGRLHARLAALARVLVSRPKTVIAAWLLIVAATLPFATQLSSVLTQQGASKTVPGTASAHVGRLLARQFPAHSERETVVVIRADDVRTLPVRRLLAVLDAAIQPLQQRGEVLQTTSAYTYYRDVAEDYVQRQLAAAGATAPGLPKEEALARVEAALSRQPLAPDVAALVRSSAGADAATRAARAGDFAVASDWRRFPLPAPPPGQVSARADLALVQVSYRPGGTDPDVDDLRALVRSVVTGLALGDRVTTHVTGEIPLLQDTYQLAEADNATMERVAYVVVAVVLLLFFRAVLPAVLTVAMIGLAMNVSQAWLYALGHQVHLTQFTSTIMTFVMLGAGIDYSMLLSSRYRQERLAGRPVREAVVQATARAGESVLLAGAAVVLAFGATLLSPIDWIPPLGYGGLVGIPIILLAALTLTPCLLVLLGDRFFALGWKPLADMENRGALSRALRRVVRVSRWCPLAVVLAFAVATVPLLATVAGHRLSADPVALSPATDARGGAAAVASGWGDGALFPTVVGGRLPGAASRDTERRLDRLVREVAADGGVARVTGPTRPLGADGPAVRVTDLPPEVRGDHLSPGGAVRVVVQLRGDPFSPAARATVKRIERVVDRQGLPLEVGGATRVDAEYDAALRTSFWQMVALVSVGIFVLLLLAMRSVLIPIRLVATIMMSNVWAVAVTVLVFQVWRHEPVINDLPVFLVILMMGLGMDYEIFLVTRVRDLVRRGDSDAAATMTAVVDTGRVITAAGLVMAGSLGTMMLSSTLMLQQYGVGLGSAVLLDATLVRMFFVPASLLLFRRLNWWVPRWPFRRVTQAVGQA